MMKFMLKTEGIVMDSGKFDDTGNRMITTREFKHSRDWTVIDQPQTARGHKVEPQLARARRD
jgi:hypothetical protein